MARLPRIVVPGQPLHIIQRGNNRQSCFFADDDHCFYLASLKDAADRRPVRVPDPRLRVDDQSCPPAADAGQHRGTVVDATVGWAALRALRQRRVPPQWDPVGGPLQIPNPL